MSEETEKDDPPKPEETKPVELSGQELEKVAGGAFNAYLVFKGTKQSAEKGS